MRHRVAVGVLVLLAALFCWMMYQVALDAPAGVDRRRALGIARMALGLAVVWIGIGGGLMVLGREAVRARVLALGWNWRVTFVLSCILLACLEEAVTVTLTNLAPLFGSRVGEAYITASANYLDVILLHSVVVFIPYFLVLAWILGRWDFSPFAVFLSFGIVGTAGEAIFAGNLGIVLGFAMWIFVYGLMVWLPVCCLPAGRGARPVGWGGHLVLPFAIFGLAMPMIVPMVYVISVVLGHPAIDFAPQGG